MDVFPYLVEKKGTEQLEKFNALKASKPEAAEIVDHMELKRPEMFLRF
jgi:hypothetical protein